jgi:hypothetical protein
MVLISRWWDITIPFPEGTPQKLIIREIRVFTLFQLTKALAESRISVYLVTAVDWGGYPCFHTETLVVDAPPGGGAVTKEGYSSKRRTLWRDIG